MAVDLGATLTLETPDSTIRHHDANRRFALRANVGVVVAHGDAEFVDEAPSSADASIAEVHPQEVGVRARFDYLVEPAAPIARFTSPVGGSAHRRVESCFQALAEPAPHLRPRHARVAGDGLLGETLFPELEDPADVVVGPHPLSLSNRCSFSYQIAPPTQKTATR